MNDKKLKYIIDLDGTLLQHNRLIPHADQFIDYLSRTGRDFIIFTNNPEHSPAELSRKLGAMNMPVGADRIITAGCVARDYLVKQAGGRPLRVFVVGTRQLKDSLIRSGIEIVGKSDPIADYVVIGFEREFCYETLRLACFHVFAGAYLVATNADETIPTEEGPIPHTGALMAAVEYATGVKALVLGKPESYAFETIQKKLGCSRSELCVIGDRLDTDMKFGQMNGLHSFLVLTGVTKKDMQSHPPGLLFDHSFDSLLDVMNYDMLINIETT